MLAGGEALDAMALITRAEQIAGALLEAGIRPGDVVGLLVQRRPDAIAAMLGVLASGAAWTPLDPSHPLARRNFQIWDASAKLVLGNRALLAEGAMRGLALEDVAGGPPDALPQVSGEAAAYVLYTSGSTGSPKGVAISQTALASTLAGVAERPGLGPGDTVLATAPFIFDMSILDALLPLYCGARLILAEEARDGAALARLAVSVGASWMQATPSLLRNLLAGGFRGPPMKIISAGERLDPALARALLADGHALWNGYGLTEAAIASAFYRVRSGEDPIPVGEALPGVHLAVLDNHGAALEAGVSGEIAIGGVGVARGYLSRAALTAARFREAAVGRCFLTGDRGYLREDGALVVVGRVDSQLKIRGMRVEIEEVEAALVACSDLVAAAVQARPGPEGAPRLCAWVVPAAGATDVTARVQAALIEKLPLPMRPVDYVVVERLPLNAAGKVDRAALPDPAPARGVWLGPLVAPADGLESRICEAFSVVLGGLGVGAHDSLVALGGSSLQATQVAVALGQQGQALSVAEILSLETPARLAMLLVDRQPETPILRGPRPAPPTWAAEGVWTLTRLDPTALTWQEGARITVRGVVDAVALRDAVLALMTRHEVLRTRPAQTEDGPRLVGVEAPELRIGLLDEEARDWLRAPYELEAGPLLRVALGAEGADAQTLWLGLHHAVADGWSLGVIAQDLAAILAGQRPAPLALDVGDVGWWQRQRGGRDEDLTWWRDRLAGAPTLALPRSRAGLGGAQASTTRWLLDELSCAGVSALGRAGATPYMVVLAALAAWLHQQTGQVDLPIGALLSGRARPELAPLVGFLANTAVLRIYLTEWLSFTELVLKARQTLLEAAAHQAVSFAELVAALRPARAVADQPLVQVCLVGQDGPDRIARAGQVQVQVEALDLGVSPFDLLIQLREVQGRFELSLSGRRSRFSAEDIAALADDFGQTLSRLVAAPEGPVCAPRARLDLGPQVWDSVLLPVPDEAGGVRRVGVFSAETLLDVATLDHEGLDGLVQISHLPRDEDGAVDEAALRHALAQAGPPRRRLLHQVSLPGGSARGMTAMEQVEEEVVPKEVADAPPALRHGPALERPAPAGLAAMLLGASSSSKPLIFLDDELNERQLSYADLLAEALAVAGGLVATGLKSGDSALILLRDQRALVPAIWGCFLAGVIAVPLAAPASLAGPSEPLARALHAWGLLDGPPVIIEAEKIAAFEAAALAEGRAARGLSIESLLASAPRPAPVHADPDATALLLLTSGSTGAPKAVAQTGRTLCHFVAAYGQAMGFSAQDVFLNWLGLDHVAPLLMVHVSAVALGAAQVHAPTFAFLEQPTRWLDWTSRYRANTCFAPNFAFGLVADAAASAPPGTWDLSCARAFTNGGESIVPATARRFIETLSRQGFPASGLVPIWGMSETNSATVLTRDWRRESTRDGDGHTALGGPVAGFSMRIADEHHHVLSEGSIGRLEVRGACLTPGYHRRPDANAESFTEDGWFDTGDLGFIGPDGLVLTGRAKDLIIVRGVNVGCHEIEAAVEAVPGVARSFVAAVAVRPPGAQTDAVAVFLSPIDAEKLDDDALRDLLGRVRAAAGKVGVDPAFVLPVRRDQIPKTEIGKLQRSRLKASFDRGDLDALIVETDLVCGGERTLPVWFNRPVWRAQKLEAAAPASWCCLAKPGGEAARLAGALGGELRTPMPGEQAAVTAYLWLDGLDVQPDDEGGDPLLAGLAAAERLRAWVCALPTQNQRTRLVIATRSAVDPPSLALAPLRGLATSLAHERPDLITRLVDLDGEDEPARLLAEAVATGPNEVMWRGGRRLVAGLEAVDLARAEARPLPFGPDAPVLITGGLGALGAILGEVLLREHRVSLLVVGRARESALADEAAHSLRSLRASASAVNGRFHYVAADVADAEALSRAVQDFEAACQAPLRCALHLAALMPVIPLTDETTAGLHNAARARAIGARNLAEILSARPEATLICFGSVNDHFGGYGVGAYAAAGRAVEAVLAPLGPRARVLSWSAWDGLGLGRVAASGARIERRGFHRISARDGLRSLVAALYRADGDLIIGLDQTSPAVLARLDGPVYRFAPAPQPAAPPRVAARPPSTALETELLAIWRELLLAEEIGVEDNYFDVGGTSLLLAELGGRIGRRLGRTVPIVRLFQNPTVRGLATWLQGEKPLDMSDAERRGAQQRAALARRGRGRGA